MSKKKNSKKKKNEKENQDFNQDNNQDLLAKIDDIEEENLKAETAQSKDANEATEKTETNLKSKELPENGAEEKKKTGPIKEESEKSKSKKNKAKKNSNKKSSEEVEKTESSYKNENDKKDNAKENDKNTGEKNKEITKDKAIIKVEQPSSPTLVEQAEERKKRNISILIGFLVFGFAILIFSVIFALINITNSDIISGVIVKNIDVSNLSVEDAKKRIIDSTNIELNNPIKIKSKEYETTINSNQIEFSYNVPKAIETAHSYGRNGNIFQNNYAILKSTIFGKTIDLEYSYNEETLNQITEDIESKIPGLVTEASFYREGNELVIVPGTDGISVDKDRLKEEIINTILSAKAEELKENNAKLEIEIPVENAKAKDIDIDKIYEEIHTAPKDAYYEAEPFKIYAEVEGVDFAISKDEAKKIIKEKKSEYRIPLTITPAEKTIQDIGLEAFPYLISEFSTKYDASNINRSKNLAIAAGKINGFVLMPGDEFSFNQVVGKRTIEEGYKDAKIYQNGQVVDGLAGGICQISSTLYNAAVKANLEITERRNHSFTTSYIRAGQDATVVYGVADLKFKNTRTYPIKITGTVNSGIADFKINGIKEDVEYDISLSPVTTGTIPFGTQVVPDPSLAPGQQVSVQRGASGLRVTTYKDTKLDGKLISREVFTTDTYSPMQNIIRVGP